MNRHSLYETTVLKRGCTIGANATIVCGVTVGRYAFVGAGVRGHQGRAGLRAGRRQSRPSGRLDEPARPRLGAPDADGVMRCPESGYRYQETEPGVLRCLDLDEDAPLPAELSKGTQVVSTIQRGSQA